MPHFLTHYWQALSAPAGRVRKHFTKDTAAHDVPAENESTRAEELEHISVYARAGYFNMGYTVEAFQLPGESPLH
jgi:IS5 family transposase